MASCSAGAEVCPGVEQPVSHEAEAAATQRPPLPQPRGCAAAAGRLAALTLQHQEVRQQLETLDFKIVT